MKERRVKYNFRFEKELFIVSIIQGISISLLMFAISVIFVDSFFNGGNYESSSVLVYINSIILAIVFYNVNKK
jgi:hypothetical protein